MGFATYSKPLTSIPAKVRNTVFQISPNQQNNVNASFAGATLLSSAPVGLNGAGVNRVGDVYTFDNPGQYEVNLTLNVASTGQRTNIGVDIIHSVLGNIEEIFGSNYIRRQSGHNGATTTFSFIIEITDTTHTLEFIGKRRAGAGVVTVHNTSKLNFKRLD